MPRITYFKLVGYILIRQYSRTNSKTLNAVTNGVIVDEAPVMKETLATSLAKTVVETPTKTSVETLAETPVETVATTSTKTTTKTPTEAPTKCVPVPEV